jgi:hypothetical protein
MVKDLLPLSAYLRAERRAWWRTTLFVAATFDAPVIILILVASAYAGRDGRLFLLGGMMGVAFGLLRTVWTAWATGRTTRRIYRGDPAIVPAPPEGAHEYRLTCRCISPIGMEGHLYAAPDALTFVPHRNNPVPEAPFTIPAGPALVFETFDAGLRGLTRTLSGPQRLIRVRNGEASALFVTPEPDVVADSLRGYYRIESASPSPPNG